LRNTGQQRNRPPRLGLEESRLRNGITLEEIAEATKISRRFLIAIEAGDYGVLPGGVFTTSYIRQYAAAAGVDASVILEHYTESCQPATCGTEADQAPKQPPQSVPKWAARFFSIG
jgi:cytoskeletal protein RodZ